MNKKILFLFATVTVLFPAYAFADENIGVNSEARQEQDASNHNSLVVAPNQSIVMSSDSTMQAHNAPNMGLPGTIPNYMDPGFAPNYTKVQNILFGDGIVTFTMAQIAPIAEKAMCSWYHMGCREPEIDIELFGGFTELKPVDSISFSLPRYEDTYDDGNVIKTELVGRQFYERAGYVYANSTDYEQTSMDVFFVMAYKLMKAGIEKGEILADGKTAHVLMSSKGLGFVGSGASVNNNSLTSAVGGLTIGKVTAETFYKWLIHQQISIGVSVAKDQEQEMLKTLKLQKTEEAGRFVVQVNKKIGRKSKAKDSDTTEKE